MALVARQRIIFSFFMCSKWEVHLNNLKSIELKFFKKSSFCIASDSSSGPVNAFCVGVEMAHSYTFGNTLILLGCLYATIFIFALSQALATPLNEFTDHSAMHS